MNDAVQGYCRDRNFLDTLQAVPEERSILGRAKEWRNCAADCRLSTTCGSRAAAALTPLYRPVRLFVNFFQPSFKLAEKSREGAKVRKSYHPPATPCQRLIADARATDEIKQQVKAGFESLDPVPLLSDSRAGQRQLVAIADAPEVAFAIEQPTLEQFLSNLRIAWREAEVPPTARRKASATRKKCNPRHPFALVAADLHAWFEAEPMANVGRTIFPPSEGAPRCLCG